MEVAMFRIMYNNASNDDICGGITFDKNQIIVNINARHFWGSRNVSGMVMIENVLPYSCYTVVYKQGSINENHRNGYQSDFKVLECNKLGSSVKVDLCEMALTYGREVMMHIYTGVWTDSVKDMVIVVTHGKYNCYSVPDNFDVESYNRDEFRKAPRIMTQLWDGYKITIDDNTQYQDREGNVLFGENKIIDLQDRQSIPVAIQKCNNITQKDLSRNCDNETVFIDCSCGIVDTKRVELHNGRGTFNIFPFGYKGKVKLKLGRKYWDSWNDYSLQIE